MGKKPVMMRRKSKKVATPEIKTVTTRRISTNENIQTIPKQKIRTKIFRSEPPWGFFAGHMPFPPEYCTAFRIYDKWKRPYIDCSSCIDCKYKNDCA